MGSYSTNWHGGGPTLKCSGNVNVSVSGLRISVSASGNSNRVYSSGHYGYSVYVYISIDGHNVGSMSFAGIGGSGSCSGWLDVGAGDHNVSLHYCCGQTGGCSQGFGDVTVYSENVHVNDPYSPPSYDIWSATQIVKVDRDKVDVNYKIDGGTNGLDWVIARVDGVKDFGFGTGKGNSLWGSFYPKWSEGFRHGSSYNVRIRFSDNHAEYQTGHKTFYTYQKPKISGVSADKTKVNANNQTITFTMSGLNDRVWTTYEESFYARAYCSSGSNVTGNGWTTVGTAGTSSTFSMTGSTLREFVNKSYDGQEITIHVIRRNNSADWNSAEKTTTFKVYYRPKKGVTCPNISYRKNSTSSGTGISKGALVYNDNTLTGIAISWVYDNTTADAGYTQGYRVRLYNANNSVVATYYTTSKSITIPKADIPKMQKTYIDITPYYGNDQYNLANSAYAGSYWYFNGTISKCDFVVMASKLAKPVITYPVEGSTWINHKFRVCFQLPADPDKDSETETYKYEDIEVSVNNKVFRITASPQAGTSGAVVASGAFSSTNLTYQRNMIVAPFKASNFTQSTTYKVKVRVKKKYTTDVTNWSEWSAVRTFYINEKYFGRVRGDLIMASDYNSALAYLDSARKVYNVTWNNKPSDVVRGTTILRTQYPYANLYDRVVAIKNQVNNYGTFDNTAVRFDSTNQIAAVTNSI